jgi:hypothetical protein
MMDWTIAKGSGNAEAHHLGLMKKAQVPFEEGRPLRPLFLRDLLDQDGWEVVKGDADRVRVSKYLWLDGVGYTVGYQAQTLGDRPETVGVYQGSAEGNHATHEAVYTFIGDQTWGEEAIISHRGEHAPARSLVQFGEPELSDEDIVRSLVQFGLPEAVAEGIISPKGDPVDLPSGRAYPPVEW